MAQPRRTQAERTAKTTDALLTAALELIAAQGWSDATLEAIATRAGVSKGAVLHHFSSKDALLGPVLERALLLLQRSAAEALASTQGPPIEQLRHALRVLWRSHREGRPEAAALAELVLRASRDATVRAAVAPRIVAMETQAAQRIEQMLAAVGLRLRVPPMQLVRVLFAQLAGAALLARVDEGDSADAPLQAIETVLQSLVSL